MDNKRFIQDVGFSVKFNWVLQINPPAGLQLKGTYPFSKSENRIFPIGVPIDLIDKERVAVANRGEVFTSSSAQ